MLEQSVPDNRLWWSMRETQQKTGFSRSTIYRLMEKDMIHGRRILGRLVISPESVKKLQPQK